MIVPPIYDLGLTAVEALGPMKTLIIFANEGNLSLLLRRYVLALLERPLLNRDRSDRFDTVAIIYITIH